MISSGGGDGGGGRLSRWPGDIWGGGAGGGADGRWGDNTTGFLPLAIFSGGDADGPR